MTGDHERASYDDRTPQGTTTTTGPAAGWYADPGDPAQLRYYDGGAWTHHVAPRPVPVPAPVLAPAYAATPSYTATPAYGARPAYGAAATYVAAPAYGSGPAWPTAPATPSSSAGVVRVIIIVAVVVVAVSGIVGGLRGVAKGRATAQPAPGPALTLSNVAPETLIGRTPSTGADIAQERLTLLAQTRGVLGQLPGMSPAKLEIYGPGPKTAPERGLGMAMLVWTGGSTPFDQDEFAAGFSDGAVRGSGGRATTTTAPDGGLVVCHETVQEVGPTTLCLWMRSGTGLVMLAEYDVASDTVRTDLAGVVAQMARP